jgi:hypothetical protein
VEGAAARGAERDSGGSEEMREKKRAHTPKVSDSRERRGRGGGGWKGEESAPLGARGLAAPCGFCHVGHDLLL